MERTGRTDRGAAGGQFGYGRSRGGEPDLLLRWGNRKRLRCAKIQVRDEAAAPRRTTAGDPSLRRRAPSPHRPFGYNTRNSEASATMKQQQQQQQQQQGINGVLAEGPRGGGRKAGNGGASAGVAAKESGNGKGGGGEAGSSSSGSEAAAAWPNMVIALTATEKEEDFLAFKGTKLPQRPKKRAKLIQRTLNQVSPGAWLCDLTLERYEVREKKVSKKTTPRGLKAMGSMESESE